MAYCIYCGRQLEEREICDCRDVQDHQRLQAKCLAGIKQRYREKSGRAREIHGVYQGRLFQAFSDVLKRPVQSGREFVALGDAKPGIGFLVIQALLSGIFALVVCNRINTFGEVQANSYVYDDSEYQNILHYPRAFLLTFIGSLLLSLVITVLLYLGVQLFQGKTAIRKILCIVAVRSAGESVFVIISIVVAYLNIAWGLAIFILLWFAGLAFMIPVMEAGIEFNVNLMPYITVMIMVLSIIAFMKWAGFSLPMYVSGERKEWVEGILEQMKSFEIFNSFFYYR